MRTDAALYVALDHSSGTRYDYARAGIAPHLGDETLGLQGPEHPVGIDPADLGDLGPGYWLLVGDDRQGLQRRR